MMDIIYVEREVADHPRAREIRARYPSAATVICERYGEIFNLRAQSFRLQKRRPALILARKNDNLVREIPSGYGIGAGRNYTFSHMLNCVYDCSYCYLRGSHLSAHLLLFVNYDDFEAAMRQRAEQAPAEPCHFFSGFGCDSLALDAVTGFTDHFLPLLESLPNAYLELRTKSVNIAGLSGRPALSRVVVAFSLAPPVVVDRLERGTPCLERRLDAMALLAAQGWPIGLRFDPLIYFEGFQRAYAGLFDSVFSRIDPALVHSVSYGPLRFPREVFDRMVRLYPDQELLAGPLVRGGATVSYDRPVREGLYGFCSRELTKRIPGERLFYCDSEPAC